MAKGFGAADAPARSVWAVFALCFAIAALEGYDLQVLAVAVPALRKAMGLNPEQLGIALSASLAGLAIGAMLGGSLADRIGRRGVLIASVLSLGVFTLLTALAHDYPTLLVARVATGFSIGGAMPNLVAIIAATVGPKRTTSFVTAVMCGMPFGGILSAMAGLTLVPHWGWQGLFVAGGAVTLLLSPLLMAGIPEVAVRQPGHAVVPPTEALFGSGRAGATVALWATFILTLTVFSLLIGWAPTLAVDKGFAPALGSAVMLWLNLSGIIGAILTGRLCDAYGVRVAMLATYAGIVLGLILFAAASTPGMLILASIVAGFFVLGAQFALYGVAPRLYPAELHGTGVGAATAMGRVGSILGPILAGWLLKGGMSVDGAIYATIPIAVAAGGALLLTTLLAPAALAASKRLGD